MLSTKVAKLARNTCDSFLYLQLVIMVHSLYKESVNFLLLNDLLTVSPDLIKNVFIAGW